MEISATFLASKLAEAIFRREWRETPRKTSRIFFKNRQSGDITFCRGLVPAVPVENGESFAEKEGRSVFS